MRFYIQSEVKIFARGRSSRSHDVSQNCLAIPELRTLWFATRDDSHGVLRILATSLHNWVFFEGWSLLERMM